MNENILLNIIRGFVSFVMAILMFISVVAFWAQATVLDYNKVSTCIDDEAYTSLQSEVCENITENTVSTGLPEDILTAPLTKEIIKTELDSSLASLYNNTKYKLVSTTLRDDYTNAISQYALENNLEISEEETESLVDYIIKLIENSIKIPFSNTLSPYFTLIRNYIGKVAFFSLAACAAVLVFLFFLCRPRTVALRYFGRAFMCVGILGSFVSLYVTTKEIVSSVNIASLAYSNAILSISKDTFNSLLIISVIIFVIGVLLSLVPVKYREAAAENTDAVSDESDKISENETESSDESIE